MKLIIASNNQHKIKEIKAILGGSFEEIEESMKRLYDLEGDYNVYPGHEASTTLERERRFNPYMKGI